MEIRHGKTTLWVAVMFACAALASCSDEDRSDLDKDGGTDTDSGTDAAQYTVTATLDVPLEFDAIPVMLASAFSKEVPGTEDTNMVPDGVGDMVQSPGIKAGQTFEYVTKYDHELLAGDYYFSVVLYVQGGGGAATMYAPVPGVDWGGIATSPVALGTGSVVITDPIPLSLIPAGDADTDTDTDADTDADADSDTDTDSDTD